MNCIIIDDDEFTRKDLEHKIKQTISLHFVGSYPSVSDATCDLMTGTVDLIFLDALMPQISGIDFLKTFTILKPEIILMSGDPLYAVDAFEYDATDFFNQTSEL